MVLRVLPNNFIIVLLFLVVRLLFHALFIQFIIVLLETFWDIPIHFKSNSVREIKEHRVFQLERHRIYKAITPNSIGINYIFLVLTNNSSSKRIQVYKLGVYLNSHNKILCSSLHLWENAHTFSYSHTIFMHVLNIVLRQIWWTQLV